MKIYVDNIQDYHNARNNYKPINKKKSKKRLRSQKRYKRSK